MQSPLRTRFVTLPTTLPNAPSRPASISAGYSRFT